jgi:hypothetical protein
MHDHRWQYRVETIKPGVFKKQDEKNKEVEERLARFGTEGWELVTVIAAAGAHPCFYLKRKY